MSRTYDKVVIRYDLKRDGLSIPLGGAGFYWDGENGKELEYRYLNDAGEVEPYGGGDTDYDNFQVRFEGKWLDACSVDFDFVEDEDGESEDGDDSEALYGGY
jgi:hypothetical protein